MVLCEGAALVPIYVVRDIWSNKESYKLAADDCASRMKCLVGWLRAAAVGKPTVVNCGEAPTPPAKPASKAQAASRVLR
jgi:hypothetical protein